MATDSFSVAWLEPVARSLGSSRTRWRLPWRGGGAQELSNAAVVEADFMDAGLDHSSFGFVTMIATLHHMDTRAALNRAVDMLNGGGVLYVLGLTRIDTRRDLAFAIRSLPRARIVGALRGEQWPDGVPVADPRQTFEEVRRDVEAVLVGARLRRRPYYRFSLEWTKPPN